VVTSFGGLIQAGNAGGTGTMSCLGTVSDELLGMLRQYLQFKLLEVGVSLHIRTGGLD
jgi:hypothetical protein